MIDIGKKCCGCNSCAQSCPKQCISMSEDNEGFLYPSVDTNLCVECHLCEKVCPVLNISSGQYPISCYAAKSPDEQIRKESSSGGIFSLLAQKIIENGGVVFGAAFNKKWEVVHCYTETLEGLNSLRGSKYVQSKIGNAYEQVKTFLKNGRLVLFSGTPCQIAGLKTFLRKDYENLITLDFVCHGVPSPGVFRWYLQEQIYYYAARKSSKNSVFHSSILSIPKREIYFPDGVELDNVFFRDKRKGWKKYCFSLLFAEASADGKRNTVSFSYVLNECKYLDGFFNDLYLRPCCYGCNFKGLRSGADITIGDFWNIHTYNRKWDDDKGVSCVIVQSKKGKELFSKTDSDTIEVPYDVITLRNPSINHSAKIDKTKREIFFAGQNKEFSSLIDSLCKPSFKQRVYKEIYNLLEVVGLMRIIHLIKYYKR